MKIGIIDADLCWRKKHRFPNLACMKLSGYHKSCGDETALLLTPITAEISRYDRVYLSKVFTDTPVPAELLRLPNVLTGGTGFLYDKAPPLLPEFERIGILMKYHALPYITRFSQYTESPYRGMYITLARWCNQPEMFRKKSFRQFVTDEGLNHSPYRYAAEFERKYPYIAKCYDMNPIGGDHT